jgi:diguanylate cyclase (GGDEF)-like protein
MASEDRQTKTTPAVSRGGDIFTVLRKGPLLLVLYGEELGKRYYIEQDEQDFGRSLKCHSCMENPSVSRRHFKVFKSDTSVWIADLGSTNGTFVNGVRLGEAQVLNPGDLISVGNVILKYLPKEDTGQFFNRELFRLSTIDPITDAYNKQFFLDIVAKEVERSTRYQHPLSLILIDVDEFERINQQHGTAVGDAVLRAMTRLVMETIRKQDVFARYDEDTFGMLLPETDVEHATFVAERLRARVSEHKFQLDEERDLVLKVSLGVATLNENVCSVSALLRQADEMLYRAKREGKDRVAS